MIKKNNILRDLPAGQAAEAKVVQLLEALGLPGSLNKAKGKLSEYDIEFEFKTRHLTIEVKNDLYAHKSGNIAIETFNPKTGKPSGLGITKADFWCHMVDGLYFTKVSTLKEYIDKTKPFKLVTSGGDDNATLYLYRADSILPDIFVRLDTMSDLEIFHYFDEYGV